MNSFCENFGGSLCQEFEIEVKVFVSKKKKLVHMSLVKPLIFYKFFNDIIKFIRKYLNMRKRFYPGFFFFSVQSLIKVLNGVFSTLQLAIVNLGEKIWTSC